MELLLLGMLPLAFLIAATGALALSQTFGFLQFMRSKGRLMQGRIAARRFMEQLALGQTLLAARTRQLEAISRKLKLNNEELARLNAMKGKFLSMAVHDMRNPLASIKGFADLMRLRASMDEKERRNLSNISSAAEQLTKLLGDLTDLAVIEAGKLRIERTAVDLAALVGDVAPIAGFLASKKGIVFEADEIPPGTTMVADRFRLGRVLSNLLGNAVKFTPAGGRVELRARCGGGAVVFLVKDTGPGIHPSERRLIFQKFYQSRHIQDPAARSGGWGLGLAISEEIVRGHGGELGVESAGLGKGSTFWVKVPLVPRRELRPRLPARRQVLAAFAAALLAAACLPASAQVLPLDEKAKYEHSLEERAQGVLQRILGPNRSKVVVDATVDFTRIERFEAGASTSAAKAGAYSWSSETPDEILPGMPVAHADSPAAAPPRSYERRNMYPVNFVKRLAVTLILDRSVGEAQSEEVRAIVTDLLEVRPERGDGLTVVRTNFTPLWKAIWYEPATAGLVVKYLLIGTLCLMTLIAAVVCLLKLSESMNEMAKAQSQSIAMEMRALGAPPESPEDAAGGAPKDGAAAEAQAGGDSGPAEIVFNVRPDQAETLAGMLAKEDPGNVAVVATHLQPEVRKALLAALPRDVSEAVLACLGRVRYLEPDVILELKEELERRLAGAVGGLGSLVEVVSAADMAERGRLIEVLRARDPELAQQVREKIFLLEDLARLSCEEWSLLHSHVGYDDWAAALSEGPEIVVNALKESMPEGAWKVIEQMIAGRAGKESMAAAQEKVAQVVGRLVKDGRIANPASPRRLESPVESPDGA